MVFLSQLINWSTNSMHSCLHYLSSNQRRYMNKWILYNKIRNFWGNLHLVINSCLLLLQIRHNLGFPVVCYIWFNNFKAWYLYNFSIQFQNLGILCHRFQCFILKSFTISRHLQVTSISKRLFIRDKYSLRSLLNLCFYMVEYKISLACSYTLTKN